VRKRMPTEVLMSFDIESVHCCIVSLWVVITLLPFAFIVSTLYGASVDA
jgi:hypothetical protein